MSVRPGGYKMPMGRMSEGTDENANVRVERKNGANPPIPTWESVWKSSSGSGKIPYTVTGGVKLAGL